MAQVGVLPTTLPDQASSQTPFVCRRWPSLDKPDKPEHDQTLDIQPSQKPKNEDTQDDPPALTLLERVDRFLNRKAG